jgi:hypothetical protein
VAVSALHDLIRSTGGGRERRAILDHSYLKASIGFSALDSLAQLGSEPW